MATSAVRSEPPLIVIVGPTASGKSALAIRLAKAFNGEVISADSRAVYKGLDIGTAKPSLEEREGIVHWGFDLVEPGQRFTAADFKQYALRAIADIRGRGKLPILVGGTGLYVDAVVYDYSFSGDLDEIVRQKYSEMSLDELYYYCKLNNILFPENFKNKRHVVNNILRAQSNQTKRSTPIDNTIIVGVTTEKEALRQRIEDRAEVIFSSAMYDEARRAGEAYGWGNEAMTGNIYPLLHDYFEGHLTLERAKEKFKTLDWRLAKRQLTWLRRSEHIHWTTLDEAYTYIARLVTR